MIAATEERLISDCPRPVEKAEYSVCSDLTELLRRFEIARGALPDTAAHLSADDPST